MGLHWMRKSVEKRGLSLLELEAFLVGAVMLYGFFAFAASFF